MCSGDYVETMGRLEPCFLGQCVVFPSYCIVKQKIESRISLLSVHDHCFKQGTVHKHTLNHSMYGSHEVDVGGFHYVDFGSWS